MAYKFNNGRGGVICDVCRVLIDADLSFKEYEDTWGKSGNDGDICPCCINGIKPKEKKDIDVVNDGWKN